MREHLRETLKTVEGIQEAYIYGSYARDTMETHSDIDLLVVGNHSIALLQNKLNKLQKDIGREINVVNMDGKEFKKRIKNKDPFVVGIMKEKYIRIV